MLKLEVFESSLVVVQLVPSTMVSFCSIRSCTELGISVSPRCSGGIALPQTCAMGAFPLGDFGSPSGMARTFVTSIFNLSFQSALLALERPAGPAPKFRWDHPPCWAWPPRPRAEWGLWSMRPGPCGTFVSTVSVETATGWVTVALGSICSIKGVAFKMSVSFNNSSVAASNLVSILDFGSEVELPLPLSPRSCWICAAALFRFCNWLASDSKSAASLSRLSRRSWMLTWPVGFSNSWGGLFLGSTNSQHSFSRAFTHMQLCSREILLRSSGDCQNFGEPCCQITGFFTERRRKAWKAVHGPATANLGNKRALLGTNVVRLSNLQAWHKRLSIWFLWEQCQTLCIQTFAMQISLLSSCWTKCTLLYSRIFWNETWNDASNHPFVG